MDGSRAALITAGQPHAVYEKHVNKFGANADVDGAVDIWTPDIDFVPQTVATKATIDFAHIDDLLTGLGMQKITIEGVSLAGVRQSEEIDCTGTGSDAVSLLDYKMIDRAYGSQWGANKTNTGAITISNTPVTATMCHIAAGKGKSQMAIAYIDNNHLALVRTLWASINNAVPAGTYADFELQSYIDGGWKTEETASASINGNGGQRLFPLPLVFMENTILRVRCMAVQAVNTYISAGFDYEQWTYGTV